MINETVFKSYDIRGAYPEAVNKELVAMVCRALAKHFAAGKVVIGHDVRHGSVELAAAAEQALLTSGQELGKKFVIINIGQATTPLFYFTVNHSGALGGLMITASHNPPTDNGVKVVGPGAEMISGSKVLELVRQL